MRSCTAPVPSVSRRTLPWRSVKSHATALPLTRATGAGDALVGAAGVTAARAVAVGVEGQARGHILRQLAGWVVAVTGQRPVGGIAERPVGGVERPGHVGQDGARAVLVLLVGGPARR